MSTEKEKWINEVLESASGIERAEANPFLYERIVSKINSPAGTSVSGSSINIPIRWVIAFALLLAFNGITLIQHSAGKKEEKKEYLYQQVSSDLNFTTTYNY